MSARVLLLHLSLVSFARSSESGCGQCPTDFVKGKNNKCYKLYAEKKTWELAKKTCSDVNSHLAMIESTDDVVLLKSLLDNAKGCHGSYFPTNAVWTAGIRSCQGNCFVWQNADGSSSTMSYTNWGKGEPNDFHTNEDCLHLHQDLTWNDDPCSYEYCVLCQTEL